MTHSPTSPTAESFRQSTARTLIRPMRDDDAPLFCGLYSDTATMRLIAPPLSEADAMESFHHTLALQHASPMRWLAMVIEDAASGSALGILGVPKFDADAPWLEIGLMLHRGAHGKGYPPEVLTSFVHRMFEVLPLEEVRARYQSANKAADRAVRNIGFEPNPDAMAASGDAGTRIRSAFRGAWFSRHGGGSA